MSECLAKQLLDEAGGDRAKAAARARQLADSCENATLWNEAYGNSDIAVELRNTADRLRRVKLVER